MKDTYIEINLWFRIFYFRIFGYGLWFGDAKHTPPLFSERKKLQKRLQIGRLVIKTLKPKS